MEIDVDAEVSVKDIVNFYIKINDSSKAKRDIARLSSKDKAAALDVIASSSAGREFRIDVARYFIYDLDAVVRRKAEHFMEDLVPDWVTDPAESILKLLKSADGKGTSSRNAAVKFLFGIVDVNSLRETFTTLLNGRNRNHMAEILAIVEDYIDSSCNESEQVKIFDACLDIVVSDEIDNSIKHHASNLLSVFFKKVQSTSLGETLRRKYIEKQVDKAEGVYRYLCSGASGLNATFLDDLLRPLKDAGSNYQIKILSYFRSLLEKAKNPEEADTILDTYPDYWNQEEQPKEEKIRSICSRILRGVDELWDESEDPQVRALIVHIRFGEYANKRDLLENIGSKVGDPGLTEAASEKLTLMLRCFLHPEQPDELKLQAAQLLLFKAGDPASRLAALEYLASYLENKNLNYAEQGSIATVVESLLAEKHLGVSVRDKARYLLFIADAKRLQGEEEQKSLLGYLRGIVEGEGFASQNAERLVLGALDTFLTMAMPNEKLKKAAQYLEFKIKNPKGPATWDTIYAAP
ncbi:MAG: hypothetical protein PHP95_03735 [Desulfuromonadaceae bacterium]|nr:hypothetical protein [Desulfuromonadaceae bacterium]MDD2847547.1 hypothetical protein [Desulfuromonadaceae bacterium]MDD4132227.1 hypothetical protein [Desulfuromonadaceae bacterium]